MNNQPCDSRHITFGGRCLNCGYDPSVHANHTAMMYHYRTELLPNGYIRVFDYATKWSALYTPAGEFHSGEITIPFVEAK